MRFTRFLYFSTSGYFDLKKYDIQKYVLIMRNNVMLHEEKIKKCNKISDNLYTQYSVPEIYKKINKYPYHYNNMNSDFKTQ